MLVIDLFDQERKQDNQALFCSADNVSCDGITAAIFGFQQ